MEPRESHTRSVLEVAHLCKSFAGLKAVDDVSFTVETGEILGLIGPNGSGKTTLINLITGLLPATSGTVKVDGNETTGRKPHRVARAGIARTFQTIRLFHELTVLENVEVASVSMGHPRRKAAVIAEKLLGDLGIADWAEVLGSEIPFGHQRKLEIARALAMEPKFLFLDEPAAGLNEEESDALHDVNLTVNQGEVVTLLGRNGAGRTTTMRAIMGLTGKRSGSIKINPMHCTTFSRTSRRGITWGSSSWSTTCAS